MAFGSHNTPTNTGFPFVYTRYEALIYASTHPTAALTYLLLLLIELHCTALSLVEELHLRYVFTNEIWVFREREFGGMYLKRIV